MEKQEELAQGPSQETDRTTYRIGVGNWGAFNLGLDAVRAAAQRWRLALEGVKQPWLCWNVDPDWCLVQQRLIAQMGWTPVIGGDPRAPRPVLLPSSVLLNFNAEFQLPTMWMHFPLEFAFLFTERLAFWHSDLLVREPKLRGLAKMFAELEDGSLAATEPRRPLSQLLNGKGHRYWELIGCTTRGASQSQFEKGCGWWMNFAAHPNCPDDRERQRRQKYYWDHGVGIRYWSKRYGGKVAAIQEKDVAEGHCTRIGNKDYQCVSPNTEARFLSKDLTHNFDLAKVCRTLELDAFLAE